MALTYPNAPYFVVGGEIPIRIHNAHALVWCRNKGQIELCAADHRIFDTAIAEYGKEDHLRDHLDDLASLKARRIGRREGIK